VSAGTFGQVLKRLRESRRPLLSQSRLGDWAEFDHSYVSRLESGVRRPTRDAVNKLASALKATGEERAALLAASGFLPGDPGVLLADSSLARLHTILDAKLLPADLEQQIRTSLAVLADYASLAA
jgi:transcriptional regulator with XRE-family HTH domain